MALGGGVSANLCCPSLPSAGPESSSEQLAALERQFRCLEQEKMELSRKLHGIGSQLGQGEWVRPGATATGLATHLWALPTAEALQVPSDHRELEQLREEVQTLQDRLSGIPTRHRCCFLPPTLTLVADLLSQNT